MINFIDFMRVGRYFFAWSLVKQVGFEFTKLRILAESLILAPASWVSRFENQVGFCRKFKITYIRVRLKFYTISLFKLFLRIAII